MEDRRPAALGSFAVLPDELLDSILHRLAVRDLAMLGCASSVFYVLCTEEPLWMHMCLRQQPDTPFVYTHSWRHSALLRLTEEKGLPAPELKPALRFTGFSSDFLYRRWYRCHVDLTNFAADDKLIERRAALSPKEFAELYDGRIPVMLTDLTEDWNAKSSWTLEQLSENYGRAALRVTVASGKPVKMRLADYAAYVAQQHDEEPLYVFDEEFGESAPPLLKDYSVPPHFEEDLLSSLGSRRPPYRWLIMGPARSGASWHVDPSLTSAWNTLLVGRKRWALYPPGKVPPGVTLHVDEFDGETHSDGPTSLQWWLEVYPMLSPEEKPIEVTQLPGETIFMPSGWWHCVLNLETTVAVTHNFVNDRNFETVCLDMAPGFRHRGIARAGHLALQETAKFDMEREQELAVENLQESSDGWEEWNGEDENEDENEDEDEDGDGEVVDPVSPKTQEGVEEEVGSHVEIDRGNLPPLSSALYANVNGKTQMEDSTSVLNGDSEQNDVGFGHHGSGWRAKVAALKGSLAQNGLQGELSAVAEAEYKVHGATNGEVASLELRHWLRCLWEHRPDLQPRIWKCANLAMEAQIWQLRLEAICEKHSLAKPVGTECLPLGSGHNLVYLVGEHAVKIYVDDEGGLEAVKTLSIELELYRKVKETDSYLVDVIPELTASGILVGKKGMDSSACALPWDGLGTEPFSGKEVRGCSISKECERGVNTENDSEEMAVKPRNGRRRRRLRKRSRKQKQEQNQSEAERWPYIVLKRCEGNDLKSRRRYLSLDELHAVGGFMGRTFAYLHTLPLPSLPFVEKYIDETDSDAEEHEDGEVVDGETAANANGEAEIEVPGYWKPFVKMLRSQRSQVVEMFEAFAWFPKHLLDQVNAYLPADPAVLVAPQEPGEDWQPPAWLHADAMDDNIILSPSINQSKVEGPKTCDERVGYLVDFGGTILGDPLYDFVSLHFSAFRCDDDMLRICFEEYLCALEHSSQRRQCSKRLQPLEEVSSQNLSAEERTGSVLAEDKMKGRLQRPSYRAMCYGLLCQHATVRHIFNYREDLKAVKSMEELEEAVWGVLNSFDESRVARATHRESLGKGGPYGSL